MNQVKEIKLLNPRYLIFIALSILLVSYAMYQARFIIQGPQIRITSHTNGLTVGGHLITLEGLARNVAWLSLNDRQIFTNDKGAWSEKLLVSEGVSVVTLKATDRFGRKTEEEIELVLPTERSQLN